MTFKNSKQLLIICFITVLSMSAVAQNKQLTKADKQFDKFSYIDARDVYLKVVEDGYKSAEIYRKLGDTYYYNSDYENASKWYIKLIEEFPDEASAIYYYRTAQSYKSQSKYEQSDALMEKYIALTGESILTRNFKEERNYLSIIAFKSKNYELEKTSINTNTSDFGSAYYLNDKIAFASADGATGDKIYEWTSQPFLDIFIAKRDSDGVLTEKTKITGDVNTKYHESSPVFTKDGKTMYFTRNNFKNGKRAKKDKENVVRLELYRATLQEDGSWRDVVELPFNSDTYSTAHPALSVDEKKLYFASDMPGTYGLSDLFYVDILENNTYGTPVNLGAQINSEGRESFPFISKKGNLYFATDGRAGLGGFDIYTTPISEEGEVGTITNVGIPANSNQDDFALIIDEDQNIGYLSSNRTIETGDETSSNDDDIYRIQFSKCKVDIAGVVIDEKTGKTIPGATVVLLNAKNEQISTQTANDKARFSFPGEDCGRQFTVRASKEGFEPNEKMVNTPNEIVTLDVELALMPKDDPCPPNDLGCRLTLQPIYFDFDKSNIRPDAAVELAKILAAMRQYEELIIHIESHTDSRGNDKYNESLSERRAQSTMAWLIEKGIAPSRLSAKGYGEYRLTNECGNGAKCTEEEHQLNRRSMFIIRN